jgi:poly(A) polymerase
MKELLAMQWRFDQRHGIRAARLLQHKRFRAAYDFMLLRARCGEVDQETVDWWTEIQQLPPDEQQKLIGLKRRQGRRRRRGRRGAEQSEITDAAP